MSLLRFSLCTTERLINFLRHLHYGRDDGSKAGLLAQTDQWILGDRDVSYATPM